MCNCKKTRIMPFNDLNIRFNVAIHVRGLDGVESYFYHNLKTYGFLDLLRDSVSGQAGHCRILYMAWGTDTTSPDQSQTRLGDERGRKQITRVSSGACGIVTITTIISPNEANNIAIGELGLFAGPDATGEKDSGVLAARVVWSPPHNKNQLESVQVDWQITFG